jgi:hypothetical protein
MNYKATILTLIIFSSCSNSELEQKNMELENQLSEINNNLTETTSQLESCSFELTEIKNTPEKRFLRAQKLFSENNLTEAISEYEEIVQKFKGTNDAKNAEREVNRINKIIEDQIREEERKKSLGYKILKPSSKVSYGDLTVGIEKIWTGKRWSFDDYGSYYSLRDAERGNIHVLSKLSITSEINNPSLPPVLVYQMKGGELHLLGKLKYEFRRWKDYGSYLGNYADYGNDFSHSSTIRFNLGLQLSEEKIKNHSIYIVLKKEGCFVRSTNTYGNPEISYKESSCQIKSILNIDDFDNEYTLLKRF